MVPQEQYCLIIYLLTNSQSLTTNHEMNMSASVSPHVKSANTIQYIIHFTWQTTRYQYIFFSLKLLK